jgi:ribulose 1,5-bisphosphate synthetase/thiazole synthase
MIEQLLESQNASFDFLEPLPTEVDVLIVGGGIVGSSLAYFLGQRGVESLVLAPMQGAFIFKSRYTN